MTGPAEPEARVRGPRKSASAYRTISEVSDELEVPQHVLRFWETKFSQVRPLKRGGGRRYYRPEDVDLLRRIQKLLYLDGYTIKGVQKLLKEGRAEVPAAEAEAEEAGSDLFAGKEPAPSPPEGEPSDGAHLSPALRAALGDLLEELRRLRGALRGERE